jgi:predicted  nucleic acid-binding Zn-ribbon protein
MGKTKELTVEDKLRLIYDLQLIDSKIDEIKNTRGELPLEIQDMEDEIQGLHIRKEKITKAIDDQKDEIKKRELAIEEAKELMAKYTEQQKNVRNNREYEALSKEIEYQELEIQFAEKKIREAKFEIEKLTGKIEGYTYEKDGENVNVKGINELIKDKENNLKHKRDELAALMKETEKQEMVLNEKAEEIRVKIEPRLLRAYDRLRKNFKNGLAVVSIERGSSGGSYFTIPVQQQLEIRMRHKIVIDEHSGRILVDGDLAKEEKEKINKILDNI